MSSVELKQFLVGEPVDAKQLGQKGYAQRYPWEAIFKSVVEGTGQQVKISYQGCKGALARLTKAGILRKDDYYIISKGAHKGERQVFIVHKAKAKKE
jgi:hypothetical protein